MPIDSDRFRAVLGRFASGITIVTTRDDRGHDHGMTVSAFCSLSLAPPLVLACIDREASAHDALVTADSLVVNVLAASQEALSRRFADCPPDQRFAGVDFTRAPHGAAVIDGALAWLECRLVTRHEGGDHSILVAEVLSASARDDQPLLYYRGGYGQLHS